MRASERPLPTAPYPSPETGDRDAPKVDERTWLRALRPLPRVCSFPSGPHLPPPPPGPFPPRQGGQLTGRRDHARPAHTHLQLQGARLDLEALRGGGTARQRHGGRLGVGVEQSQRQRLRGAQAHVPEAQKRLGAEVAEGQDRRGPPQARRRLPLRGTRVPAASPRRHGSPTAAGRSAAKSPLLLPVARTPETAKRPHKFATTRVSHVETPPQLKLPSSTNGHPRHRPTPAQSQSGSSAAPEPVRGPTGEQQRRANETAALHLNVRWVASGCLRSRSRKPRPGLCDTRGLELKSAFWV